MQKYVPAGHWGPHPGPPPEPPAPPSAAASTAPPAPPADVPPSGAPMLVPFEHAATKKSSELTIQPFGVITPIARLRHLRPDRVQPQPSDCPALGLRESLPAADRCPSAGDSRCGRGSAQISS